MNPKPIEQAQSSWLARVLPALRRARQRAEEIAIETKTELVFVRDGKLLIVRPDPKL